MKVCNEVLFEKKRKKEIVNASFNFRAKAREV
jgi:hypothetical protein